MSPAQWRLGCQVFPWHQARGLGFGMNDEGRACLPDILADVASVGFAGFEVLASAVPLDSPQRMTDAMARLGLAFAGAHSGAPWWQPGAAATIPAIVDAAGRLRALGCERLIVSMYPFVPPDADSTTFRQVAHNLRDLGRACRDDAGLPAAFHNHAPELAHGAACIDAIVDACDADEMQLAPDLGWVAIGGIEPVQFVSRFGSRIAYVHARDVSEVGPRGHTLEVGRGVIDYVAVAAALDANGFDGWLVAESEYAEPWAGCDDPTESARLHMTALRSALTRRVTPTPD